MKNKEKIKEEWIKEALEKIKRFKCEKCGHTFPNYPYYDYNGEKIWICPKCNHSHRKN